MKKQRIQLILLLAVCFLCVGGYLLVKHLDLPEEAPSEEEEKVQALSFEEEDAVELTVTGSHSLHFIKDGETWYHADDRSIPTDQSAVNGILRRYSDVETASYVEQADLAEYGLDQPQLTAVTRMQDGSSLVLEVGDQNSISGEYYIHIQGDDTVYLVNSYVVNGFMSDPETFVEEPETETAAEAEAETETVAEAEAETETAAEAEAETETAVEAEAETETAAETDAGSESENTDS